MAILLCERDRHHYTNIGMTLCSCEIECTPFRIALVL
jgi:hypothetical protein